MPRKRKVNHKAVVKYAQKHPEAVQVAIGKHFGITQGSVGRILRAAGETNTHRGVCHRSTPKNGQSKQEFAWEKKLCQLGLGMDRGMRLGRQRIFYGYDPRKQAQLAESATQIEEERLNSDF
jgi:hypothetical protein